MRRFSMGLHRNGTLEAEFRWEKSLPDFRMCHILLIHTSATSFAFVLPKQKLPENCSLWFNTRYLCWGTRQLSRHNTQASSSKECVGSGSDTLSSCYQWICQHWICQKISQTQNCHTKENLKRANPFLTYKAQASIHQLHSHLSYLKNPVHFFSLAKTDE